MGYFIKRMIVWTFLAIAAQSSGIALAFVLTTSLQSELPLVMVIYLYFPTILLIEKTGHFVGCSNMIEPFLRGVPLGVLMYSVVAGFMISLITRNSLHPAR